MNELVNGLPPGVRRVLAPNPGWMTLDGTNTWVLAGADGRAGADAVVVDPGPQDDAHLDAVRALVAERGWRVGAVVVTHGHADHIEGAGDLAGGWHLPVLTPGEGETVAVDGVRLDVLSTPGHTSDSRCLLWRDQGLVLTGDTVLGRGTAVIAHPDGVLGDYLASLRRLEQLVAALGLTALLPGHGPVLDGATPVPGQPTTPLGVLRWYQEHRAERLAQVRAALDAGASTARDVVERVYADVDPALWGAAELSVRAQLDHLNR